MVADIREMLRAREEWRGPGCSDLCRTIKAIEIGQFGVSVIEQHHIPSHESYGLSLGALEAGGVVDVLTGPLAVRLLHALAYLNGEPINLTPTEFRILSTLAQRAGRVVRGEAILRDVWGPGYAPNPKHDRIRGEWHLLRVNVARLRAKLGSARDLLVTRHGVGYMLRAEPYSGPAL